MTARDGWAHATTVVAVRRDGTLALAADGQVSLEATVVKSTARKVRTLMGGRIAVGFAGGTADAFTLFERFEAKVKEFGGDLMRASVELAKEWRSDRVLRRLEALLVAGDAHATFLITGNGDVLEPDHPVVGIGSGGAYAAAAARAYLDASDLPAREIAQRAMAIAADICVYTNDRIVIEEVSPKADSPKADSPKADSPKADSHRADSPKERVDDR